MRAACVLAALAACGPPPVMLVSNVRIDGYELVIERCPVTSGNLGRSFDAWRSCATKRVPLPVATNDDVGPPVPVPTPDREAIYRRIGSARSALRGCAEAAAMRGDLAIVLELDLEGRVRAVEPAPLGACLRQALGDRPFSVSRDTTRISFSIRNPGPVEPAIPAVVDPFEKATP